MPRALRDKLFLATALATGAVGACGDILGIDYPPLRASDAGGAVTDASGDAAASDAVAPPIAKSCRGIKEKNPSAPTGTYALIGRDGVFFCDMESFGGGWTQVRPEMVTEGTTQTSDPSSPSAVQ